MTPTPQHLKEAREILSRHIFGNKSIEKSLVMQISQALSLSESRGVKKGMMMATDRDMAFINHIQDHLKQGQEVICKVCGKTAKKIIEEAEALSTQAESEEGV